MSTRTNLRPQVVIPSPQGSPANGSSMAANITSAPTVLQSLTRISYSLSWAGSSPVGSVALQLSDDYSIGANGLVNNAGTWTTVAFTLNGGSSATSAPISGNSGTGIIELVTGSYASRLVYTAVSGTGTLTAMINGKVS